MANSGASCVKFNGARKRKKPTRRRDVVSAGTCNRRVTLIALFGCTVVSISAISYTLTHVEAFTSLTGSSRSLDRFYKEMKLHVSVPQSPNTPKNIPSLVPEFDSFENGAAFYNFEDDEVLTSQANDNMLDSEIPIPSFHFIDDAEIMDRDVADILEEREDRLYVDERGIKRQVEKCILVGVEDMSLRRQKSAGPLETQAVYFTLEESMSEMRELMKTAGLQLVGEITQRLQQINPKTYVGTGKVEEAKDMLAKMDCSTICFDTELSPGQQKALENAFNKKIIQDDFLFQGGEIKVIDRTALILDIFAQHAKTREGKLQVDLALHEYRKPRLTKMWTHLERQSGAGGVGLRGPGESQLEIDKRLVRDRIIVLKKKINEVQEQRTIHRRGRQRLGLPILSLVGYTNSGKSTMLNYLTRSGVLAESMLFATLDPTTRKVKLPGLKTHPEVLLTDTVGFIQKLPTHLVAAFRATLEEVKQADVLVHVIDVSNPVWEKQEVAVKKVLAEIGLSDKPIVRVLNKVDLLPQEEAEYIKYEAAGLDDLTVAVSALHGAGMHDFVSCIEQAMANLLVSIEVIIPYSAGMELNSVHEQGNVELVDYRDSGTYVKALVPSAIANRLEKYSIHGFQNENSIQQIKKRKLIDHDGIDWVAVGRGRHNVDK
jgi:GTPase